MDHAAWDRERIGVIILRDENSPRNFQPDSDFVWVRQSGIH